MKKIDDLPKEVYAVLERGVEKTDEEWEKVGKAFSQVLKEKLSPRSKEQDKKIRMSSFGDPCERKQWMRYNKSEVAEPIEGRALLNFLYGDLIETMMIMLIKEAGYEVTGEQTNVSLHGIEGHRDCIINGMLCDIKSANTRSISKFKNHTLEKDDPFGYLDQLSLYLAASQDDPTLKVKKQFAFIAVDKELGHVIVDKYNAKDVDYDAEIPDKLKVLNHDTPPPRPYNPRVVDYRSGASAIPRVPCGYCQFKSECWKDVNGGAGLQKIVDSKGPTWYTQLARVPAPSKKNEAFEDEYE